MLSSSLIFFTFIHNCSIEAIGRVIIIILIIEWFLALNSGLFWIFAIFILAWMGYFVIRHFIAVPALNIWWSSFWLILTNMIFIWWTLLIQALLSILIVLFFMATIAIYFVIESTVNAVAPIYVKCFWVIAFKAFF